MRRLWLFLLVPGLLAAAPTARLLSRAVETYVTTANMGMSLPTPGVDTGPGWASALNAALLVVDQHNHTSGKGVRVPVGGLNINSDLPFNAWGATGLGRIQLGQLGIAPVVAGTMWRDTGGDWWVLDGSLNQIQLTCSGQICSLYFYPDGGASGPFGLPGNTTVDARGVRTFDLGIFDNFQSDGLANIYGIGGADGGVKAYLTICKTQNCPWEAETIGSSTEGVGVFTWQINTGSTGGDAGTSFLFFNGDPTISPEKGEELGLLQLVQQQFRGAGGNFLVGFDQVETLSDGGFISAWSVQHHGSMHVSERSIDLMGFTDGGGGASKYLDAGFAPWSAADGSLPLQVINREQLSGALSMADGGAVVPFTAEGVRLNSDSPKFGCHWHSPAAGHLTGIQLLVKAGSPASSYTDGGWVTAQITDETGPTVLCVVTLPCVPAGTGPTWAACQPDAGTAFAAGDDLVGSVVAAAGSCDTIATSLGQTCQGVFP